ncbi:hypothetical protein EJ05DRAFT_27514 [Pseudovirgaria hyperparasitica]|uniref:Uncharacterized protein n=1 Tax=Pseudovirgaria hyperparasitica TaxID=470096 RepID=A0A6A6WLU4_9PEZI|nr:uncharacterized protein EJ05DRAFT_27514 [Pseudovirgaria hyperparasitica]KAF2763143.1 hypothetical protein EJ05DRAFT_27514 [Pseudovirgaria hyperparasitica]
MVHPSDSPAVRKCENAKTGRKDEIARRPKRTSAPPAPSTQSSGFLQFGRNTVLLHLLACRFLPPLLSTDFSIPLVANSLHPDRTTLFLPSPIHISPISPSLTFTIAPSTRVSTVRPSPALLPLRPSCSRSSSRHDCTLIYPSISPSDPLVMIRHSYGLVSPSFDQFLTSLRYPFDSIHSLTSSTP